MVASGIGLEAGRGDRLAVDLHVATGNELLGMAAAGDARVGKDLLQALFVARGSVGYRSGVRGPFFLLLFLFVFLVLLFFLVLFVFLFFQKLLCYVLGSGGILKVVEFGERVLRYGRDLGVQLVGRFGFKRRGVQDFEFLSCLSLRMERLGCQLSLGGVNGFPGLRAGRLLRRSFLRCGFLHR